MRELCSKKQCTYDCLHNLSTVATVARWNISNTYRLVVVIEKDTRAARIAAEIQVVLDIHDAMDVSSSSVATPAGVTVDIFRPNLGAMSSDEVLNIIYQAI